ncbi:MAG: hypothetical protein LBQ66_04640 [Planctomycetaceae bacterium]|nr:hypothetical protein [Planctomycetaceae bacterium]
METLLNENEHDPTVKQANGNCKQKAKKCPTEKAGQKHLRDRDTKQKDNDRKEIEEGIKIVLEHGMDKWIELWIAKWIRKALAEGMEKGQQDAVFTIAHNLKSLGVDFEIIAKATELTVEEIEQLEIEQPEIEQPD